MAEQRIAALERSMAEQRLAMNSLNAQVQELREENAHLKVTVETMAGVIKKVAAGGGGGGGGPAMAPGVANAGMALMKAITALSSKEDTMCELLKQQADLSSSLLKIASKPGALGGAKPKKEGKKHPALGVVRLDYNYPPAEGDIDCPASFGYDLYYRCVPGLTFEVAQAGKFTEEVERNFAEAIKYLEGKGASAITGDCGFMMAFQIPARKIATKPVFMSALCQVPVICTAFDPNDRILVLTANGDSLRSQKEFLNHSCGFKVDNKRFLIKGCQDLPGFDAVARGEQVDINLVQPHVVKLAMDTIEANEDIRAVLMECTELPPYSDAVRAATGLPVWDAITGCDFYVNAYKDNPRFGVNDWQDEWDGVQEEYFFGDNLIESDKKALKTEVKTDLKKIRAGHMKGPKKNDVSKIKKKLAKKQNPILGVVRLDYNYPPSAGDIDCPGSYGYDVIFRMVPGLTFEMAQAGKMTMEVLKEFKLAVKWLESNGACGITGDCGFMMAFQPIARDVATIPVFMSSMVQCPMVSLAYDKFDKVIILTANDKTLKPQKEVLLSSCGFDVEDDRFIIIGAQDVDGFDAVANAEKVDIERVTPGMVKLVQDKLKREPSVRAIILECTELPPYADALRQATGLPVWDAITNADFFISAFKDNPRFGLNEWQAPWDGTIEEYKLGQNLDAKKREKALFVNE
eukprot:gnl/MRDRNA2_/MRDRNA2_79710_c0_seq1.p1 gnl/MRDRNA2_/MRDRNA2_79710_c0~~gnl/MRDRNA2_/MRDRNA2_79710_c0_seq1.p1  ORF type:complete len:689 (+),score=164.12 gnl/MRDRNA2_/MRDRNA2_79710_c0_seq1:106-2172(+)